MLKHVHVAAGIIRNIRQEIFITQRIGNAHLAGFWEFPGGKIELSETPEMALKRELWEETGIVVQQASLLNVARHYFPESPERVTVLHFYLINEWKGEPFGREGQPVRWVAQNKLKMDDFPPSNVSIIKLLSCHNGAGFLSHQ